MNTYNFANDKTQVTLADGVRKYTYSYDANHRVLTAAEPGSSFTLTNEYGQTTGNNNGMRVKYTEAMGRMSQITSFNYDGLRRLTSATGPLGRLTEFFYNEQGARSRIKNGSAEIYQNFDNASRLTNQRHRSGCLDFHLGRGKPVSMTNASGTTFYYVTNFRGDVIRIMDSNSVANYSYDPWGKVLSANEDPAMVGQPLRYASNVYDTETQLYYLQARYYDPDTARFISRDPNGGDQDNPLSQNLLCVCQ